MNDRMTTISELKKIVEDFISERDCYKFHNPLSITIPLFIINSQ